MRRTLWALAVLSLTLGITGACTSGARSSATSSIPPAASSLPASTPLARVSATPSPTDAVAIDTAEEAVDSVVAEHPAFDGYPLRQPVEADRTAGPILQPPSDVVGASRWVVALDAPDGFRLVFVTGSGDCPAGCIDWRYDVFLVGRDGKVRAECTRSDLPAPGATRGRAVDGDPCAEPASPRP